MSHPLDIPEHRLGPAARCIGIARPFRVLEIVLA